ncbi:lactonase family protein [Lysinibacter cavernae]|uniref:6-phosphogluconolactonase (Cycloisomerase 2 family) n=1 Tax=Lysinibacter cavernae TaxID=1640652 RepID=A0A7X5R053_9MICO|nr:6-phosphogluconolactonase (cycloisomerase 2 family) [Lysinibacter cavernae]
MSQTPQTNDGTQHSIQVAIGSYTTPHGEGTGISTLSVSLAGELSAGRAIAAASPSFLAQHPTLPLLYAVEEFTQLLKTYQRVSGSAELTEIGQAVVTGEAACHVGVDPAGRYLVVTCWGSGEVILYELNSAGRVTSRMVAEPSRDPYAAPGIRPSRAHQSTVLPDGRILTTDLGHDTVRVWEYCAGKGLNLLHTVAVGEGSGPRHMAQHPSGFVYVVTEHSVEVLVLRTGTARRSHFDAEREYTDVDTKTLTAVTGAEEPQVSTAPILLDRTSATVEGRVERDAAAEISLSPDTERLYVTVRGSNVVSTLIVHDGGSRVEALADFSCGGDWPRHHLQVGRILLVANQLSNTVTALEVSPTTGIAGRPLTELSIGSPTCLISLPS